MAATEQQLSSGDSEDPGDKEQRLHVELNAKRLYIEDLKAKLQSAQDCIPSLEQQLEHARRESEEVGMPTLIAIAICVS